MRVSLTVTVFVLAAASTLAAVQREVSPYAGLGAAERILAEVAPAELAAYREAEATIEKAWVVLRQAAPVEFEAAADWLLRERQEKHDSASDAVAESERWAEVLEAADPAAYASGRFGARFAAALVGSDATDAVDEDLAEVLLLLIRAYAADRLEAAEIKIQAAGAMAEASLRQAAPAEWAEFALARAALTETEVMLRDAVPEVGTRYVKAATQIRRTRSR